MLPLVISIVAILGIIAAARVDVNALLTDTGTMDRNIRVIYGSDIYAMTRRLLEDCDAAGMIKDKDTSIVLKPNLVTSSDPSDGATTHTEISEAIIIYLQEHGFRNITVAEGAWVGASTEECFRKLGYTALREKYGIRLVDTKKDEYSSVTAAGIPTEISRTILDAGFLIDIPVLKGHCQTRMTHAMKNLKGCLSDRSKRAFHRMGLDKPIAALCTVVRPDLVISDSICGDLDFEEGGNPVRCDRMMEASDAVLMDVYAATLMGFRPVDIGYIREAEALGLDCSSPSRIIELSKPERASPCPEGAAARLGMHADPAEACSACYAALIHALKRAEEDGSIRNLRGRKIAAGQGYRGKAPEIGIGACCRNAAINVPGCPAKADEIAAMIRSL